MYRRGDGTAADPEMANKYEKITREMKKQMSGEGATLTFGES